MYLRRINKKACGKDHVYWALVESYRTEKGVRQRTVGYIGDVSRAQAKGMHQAIERCDSYLQGFDSSEGLPLGYEIFAGNRHDSTTVKEVVDTMEKSYGAAQRIWVMDRGMISEDNIALLQQNGRRYIIGSPKSSLRKFEQHLVEKDWKSVHPGVDVKLCLSPDNEKEVFILCKSEDRAKKEASMHDRFIKNIDDGISKLKSYCENHPGIDVSKSVERRIGRLLQKNSRGASFFDISAKYHASSRTTVLSVERKDAECAHWKRRTEGHYLLRSNITDWNAQELWDAYIHLTDAEEAFRIHKSDLHLRPVWHQKDERIKAHVLVCFISFVLWKTFGLMCKNARLGDEPRRVYNEIKRIAMVDVVLTTVDDREMKIRTVPRPEKPLQVLLQHLKLALPERMTKHIL